MLRLLSIMMLVYRTMILWLFYAATICWRTAMPTHVSSEKYTILINRENVKDESKNTKDRITEIVNIFREMKEMHNSTPSIEHDIRTFEDLSNEILTEDVDKATASILNTAIDTELQMMIQGMQFGNNEQILIGSIKITTSISKLYDKSSNTSIVASNLLKIMRAAVSLFQSQPVLQDIKKFELNNVHIEDIELEMKSATIYYESVIKAVSQYSSKDFPAELSLNIYENVLHLAALFGKLSRLVEMFCTRTKHSKERRSSVEKCLQLVLNYVEASSVRQFSMMQLAALFESMMVLNTSKHFIELVKIQRQEDLQVLRCFGDPLNSLSEKLLIYELFSQPDTYSLIVQYLLTLHDMFSNVLQEHAVVCTQQYLQGFCTRLDKKSYQILPADTNVQSLYVPRNSQLSFLDNNKILKFGPFHGTSVYSDAKKFFDIKYVSLNENLHGDALNSIRLCTVNNDWCDTIHESTEGFMNISGVDMTKVNSIYIPNGINIALKGLSKQIGPVYGPFKLNNLQSCNEIWRNFTIAQDKTKTAIKMVEMCGAEELNSYCVQLHEHDTWELNPTFWESKETCKPNNQVSLKIPLGNEVVLLRGDSRYGPFTGPTNYPKFDASGITISVRNLLGHIDKVSDTPYSGILKRRAAITSKSNA